MAEKLNRAQRRAEKRKLDSQNKNEYHPVTISGMKTNLPIPHKKYSASELENFILPDDHLHERICNFPE
jgi:hypothetical protein